MAMRSFKSPVLPLPPTGYDPRYFDTLIKLLNIYFGQLDSGNPLHLEGLVLSELTTDPTNLPNHSLYRQDRNVRIKLPGDHFVTAGLSGTMSVGTVTVTIS